MAGSKDYYKILGVERNATQEDIGKAFKKLAIKWHPDKWSSASEDDRKKAEDMFKDINEANSVLSDKEKRQQYDMFGTADGNTNQYGGDPFEWFASQMGAGWGPRHMERDLKGEDLYANVTVSFEDSYRGGSATVEYDFPNKCEHCNGTGSEDGKLKTCPDCHGTGFVTFRSSMGGMTSIVKSPCRRCGGTGEINDNPCHECGGKGKIYEKRSIVVTYPAGIPDNGVMVVNGKGGIAADRRYPDGKLYVTIHVAPSDTYRRDGNVLIADLNVSIAEALCGNGKDLVLPDGQVLKVIVKPLTEPNSLIVFKGKGFPEVGAGTHARGDMVVNVVYDIPKKELSEEAKETIRKFCDLEKNEK